MKYRAEIDGLRALAVLPVIFFHAGFTIFSGGFVGVDVFFVISGYLITTILIGEVESNRFSLINFYERRARRILPALFFVMMACIPFALMWMLPYQMVDFSKSLIAVSFFISNILFWRESGYFAGVSEEKPLLHTWSLAVEEQYYLLFPIFLFLTWRFGRNKVFWIIIFITVSSFIISEVLWRIEATANFYLFPSRAWELLIGSISAFFIKIYGIRKNNFLSIIGLAAIIFSILVFDKTTPFPSFYALLPVLGTMFIILFSDKDSLVTKLLSTKLFVGIGLISYSAYLWHQPLLAFARIKLFGEVEPSLLLILSASSFLLAYLSWKFIEKPFRNKKYFSTKSIWACTCIFITLPIFIGSYFFLNKDNFESNWIKSSNLDQQIGYKIYNDAKKNPHFFDTHSDTDINNECYFFNIADEESLDNENLNLDKCFEKFGKGILVLGDSHSMDIFGMLVHENSSNFIVNLRQIGCRPEQSNRGCNFSSLDKLIKLEKTYYFKKVVFVNAGFWNLKTTFNNEVRRSDFAKYSENDEINFIPNQERISATIKKLNHYSEHFNIVWFAPRAEPHIDLRNIISKGCNYNWKYRPNQLNIFLDLEKEIKKHVNISDRKIQVASQIQAFNIDLNEDFTDCKKAFWTDSDHFSSYGEIKFSNQLPDLIKSTSRKSQN